jgi:hypothetical protein
MSIDVNVNKINDVEILVDVFFRFIYIKIYFVDSAEFKTTY